MYFDQAEELGVWDWSELAVSNQETRRRTLILSLTQSFNRHFLCTCSIPGRLLHFGSFKVSKRDVIIVLGVLTV